MPLKLIFQGAEAKILLDKKNNLIIKDRIKKSYRLPELDDKIRKSRTKREINLLERASKVINVPELIINKYSKCGAWGDNRNQLKIQFIDGKKLSEHLNMFSLTKQKQILKQIGQDIAKLHDNNIIHGDLTTSNMILVENVDSNKKLDNIKVGNNKIKSTRDLTLTTLHQSTSKASSNFKVYFIDFGLGFISHKFEDKAVDIHLLKQALEAKHFKNYKILTSEFLKGYKNSKDFEKTINQLDKVEKRGRYKH